MQLRIYHTDTGVVSVLTILLILDSQCYENGRNAICGQSETGNFTIVTSPRKGQTFHFLSQIPPLNEQTHRLSAATGNLI